MLGLNKGTKLYCVVVDIQDDVLDRFTQENGGNDAPYYNRDTHVGRIMVAKFINNYEDDTYEFDSPIGTFAVDEEEMNGNSDVYVQEAIMRCFLNVNDAVALSKKIGGDTSMGRGINADIIQENKMNRNMKKSKNVIKINENQLLSIIKESVTKILKEGKYENNKPYFKHWDQTGHYYAKPGDETLDNWNWNDSSEERSKARKHNLRAKKYEEPIKYSNEEIIKALKYFHININDWKKMDKIGRDCLIKSYRERMNYENNKNNRNDINYNYLGDSIYKY